MAYIDEQGRFRWCAGEGPSGPSMDELLAMRPLSKRQREALEIAQRFMDGLESDPRLRARWRRENRIAARRHGWRPPARLRRWLSWGRLPRLLRGLG